MADKTIAITDTITELTVDELKNHVKSWMFYDAEIAKLSRDLKKMRDAQTKRTQSITFTLSKKNLHTIDIMGGELNVKKRVTKRITTKSLLASLAEYFKDDANKDETIDAIKTTIMDGRITTEKEVIVLKMD